MAALVSLCRRHRFGLATRRSKKYKGKTSVITLQCDQAKPPKKYGLQPRSKKRRTSTIKNADCPFTIQLRCLARNDWKFSIHAVNLTHLPAALPSAPPTPPSSTMTATVRLGIAASQ
ncbi:hypothetical protein QBC32DRAFT_356948 [Pseudoneurospora amorphoporcata]|uniref:Uncharacterized protein n=1 Tax=Pseudoneurospora amorphoporcata TaxID=241081 RepID=A0AAN6SBC3_9PEZI|nr:hypothetical protein QBC32DRAFT_356948 [Pseudoneurospora amorphoporcata]